MAKRLIDQDAKEARIEKEEHWKKALSDGEGGVDLSLIHIWHWLDIVV